MRDSEAYTETVGLSDHGLESVAIRGVGVPEPPIICKLFEGVREV